jgi:FAD/FMN-containing dehydrogenase
MVLDLGLMRNVSVNEENQTVTFEGGCLWGDVDDALWPHGLATVGGTVSHTGVGGLILHGGYGILTGRYGLAIDQVISLEVVLADGNIVNVSETENPDLFWAMRGAGSNFGVVTKFTSKAYPQSDIWGGMIMFTADKLPQLVDMLNKTHAANNPDITLMLFFGRAPPMGPPESPRPPILILMIAHGGPDADIKGPEFFADILKLEALASMVSRMPYPAFNKSGDEIAAHGKRYLLGGTNYSLPLSLSTAEALGEAVWGFPERNPGINMENTLVGFELFHTGKLCETPHSATAFSGRGDHCNIMMMWAWEDEAFDGVIRQHSRNIQADMRERAYRGSEGENGAKAYVNYSVSDLKTAKEAFGSNLDRLKEVKQKYDPSNVFDKLWRLGA